MFGLFSVVYKIQSNTATQSLPGGGVDACVADSLASCCFALIRSLAPSTYLDSHTSCISVIGGTVSGCRPRTLTTSVERFAGTRFLGVAAASDPRNPDRGGSRSGYRGVGGRGNDKEGIRAFFFKGTVYEGSSAPGEDY
eukprot:1195334-Prorocentrum_minimum.AAC.4